MLKKTSNHLKTKENGVYYKFKYKYTVNTTCDCEGVCAEGCDTVALHCVPYIVTLDGGGVSAVLVLDGESQHFSLPLSFLSVCIIAHECEFVKGF